MSKKAETVVFKKASDILERDIGDGTIAVLNVFDEMHYFIIDAIAAEFWSMIDGRKNLLQITEALIKKHQPPTRDFERGLKLCIQNLEKHHLILKN